jgi:hypothetical protein
MNTRAVAGASHIVLTAVKVLAGFIAIAVFGAGIPLLWVWV